MESVYIGTEVNYRVGIIAAGFSMADNDFTVEIVRGMKHLLFNKSDLATDASGNYYVCFDTAQLGTGVASAIITAYVPDEFFPDGYRTEVQKFDLLTILAV